MKAKLDFDAKTIELESEPTLAEIAELQRALKDWQKWRIVAPVQTISVPSIWYTPQMIYCWNCQRSHELGQCYQITWTNGGEGLAQIKIN